MLRKSSAFQSINFWVSFKEQHLDNMTLKCLFTQQHHVIMLRDHYDKTQNVADKNVSKGGNYLCLWGSDSEKH